MKHGNHLVKTKPETNTGNIAVGSIFPLRKLQEITSVGYSAMRKEDILPFATTWIDLEGVMLSEISQRRTNTI